jgi:N-6 DNA methylase
VGFCPPVFLALFPPLDPDGVVAYRTACMSDERDDQARGPPDHHQKELFKLIGELACRHSAWQVFADFAEAAALAISNAVDWPQRDQREQRYLELVKRYKPDELAKFPRMLAELTLALEREPSDVLGRMFHDLELHNKWAGQFFSPYQLCRMMAKMTLADEEDLRGKIAARGFVTAMEPCCGSGAMVIALAHEMKAAGINYQQHLHVTAMDVDVKCVHMAYLQFSLLHIPAVVVHGNSLAVEEFGHWYTPAHILGGWNWKLRNLAEGVHEVQGVSEEPPERPQASPSKKPAEPTQLTLF